MPKYYNALDLYLVSSRAEGGPKAILESMATGVPLVTTKVGMAPDIIAEGHNGLLAEVDDVQALALQSEKIIEDENFSGRLKTEALNTIQNYSWEEIARQYYDNIYSSLIS